MRHAIAMLGLLAAPALGLAAASWIAHHDERPGTVWLLLSDAPGAALSAVLTASDARLVNAWFDGRLVQLRVGSLAQTRIPDAPVRLRFNAPSLAFSLPACGGLAPDFQGANR